MNKERLRILFEKAVKHESAPAEREELFALLNDDRYKEEVAQLFEQARLTFEDDSPFFSKQETNDLSLNLMRQISQSKRSSKKSLFFNWTIAASAILISLGVGFYVYLNKGQKTTTEQEATKEYAIHPGTNRATLLMGDGKVLYLDSIEARVITEGGVTISKTADGQLLYQVEADSPIGGDEVKENVLSTPKGGQYQIVLPDQTKVWLSAASALYYPTRFTGKNRTVSLVGEAYFEVAQNKSTPFIVKLKDVSVEVLGTSFLVNAYQDVDEMKTTLIEGKVAINTSQYEGFERTILKPGQQAVLNKATKNMEVRTVDIDHMQAWKSGHFVFQHDRITSVMKAIALWYDVEVVYKGDLTNETFVGTISRFEHIEDLLNTIELTGGVHFKIEGRKIIVMK